MTAWPNTFTLGGVLLDQDTAGSFRVVSSATGWDDGAEVRSGLQDRAQQDGAWDALGFRSSRKVTLEGFAQESSVAAAYALKDQLTALSPQALRELRVVGAGGVARTALVRVSGAAVFDWVDQSSFHYTLEVTAPDPLKYGAAVSGSASLSNVTAGAGRVWPRVWPTSYGITPGTTPGSIGLPNTGSAAYWPTLRVDGPVPNPTITCNQSGAWVRYNGTVLAGQWLTVDCANRRVLLNGQVSVRSRVTSSGDWLSIAPGGGSLSWAADAADPAAKLSVYGFQGAWL